MTPAQHYDAVVIGSGQGGSPLASVLAGSGRKTALVEREHVGGTCINWGCTPTKTMIASAKVAYLDHRSADYGVENGPVTIDMMKVRKRKREIVESFRGGGYVGLEFAQMFRRFGSEVTIVERGPQLLAREDADVAEAVAEVLREDDVEVLLRTQARRASQTGGGRIRLAVHTPEGERRLEGSRLLAAAGRTPNTDTLNLEAAGVETDERGFVRVNGRLETSADGIWALGDATGGPAFTHVSYDDYRVIKSNLIDGGEATTSGRLIPYTVFTDPQLGRVGLSEAEAREQGRDVLVAKMPMSWVARALEVDEARGMMKAVVDAETDRILGAAVLGIEGGEITAMLQIAMMGGLPYTALRDGIFAHPTLAESLNNLFATIGE